MCAAESKEGADLELRSLFNSPRALIFPSFQIQKVGDLNHNLEALPPVKNQRTAFAQIPNHQGLGGGGTVSGPKDTRSTQTHLIRLSLH